MNKLFSMAVMALFLGASIASCKKCITCTYEDGAGNTVSSGEVCGSDDELDLVEDTYEAAATLAGTEADCNRK